MCITFFAYIHVRPTLIFFCFIFVGVAQGIITGIRGLCNGLGPALFGFIFYLFHVDLDPLKATDKPVTLNHTGYHGLTLQNAIRVNIICGGMSGEIFASLVGYLIDFKIFVPTHIVSISD